MWDNPEDSSAEGDALALLDAHDQAKLVRDGKITAPNLVNAAINRIERINLRVNAITSRRFAEALDEAKRPPGAAPMAGVPCLLKDSLPYRGMPSYCGSRLLLDSDRGQGQFALADRLDEAGLIQLGKTSVPEFSLLPTTEGDLFGPTRNPWDLTRSAGGSSGGGAVAVATGMVPLAHGADGGGSIRIPASCCGVVGFKASRGGNLRARQFHLLEDVIVSDGLFTRTIRDAAWALRWLRPDTNSVAGKSGKLRIALCLTNMAGSQPHPDVATAVLATARLCENLGHDVIDIAKMPDAACAALPLFHKIWLFLARDAFHTLTERFGREKVEHSTEAWFRGLANEAMNLGPNDLAATMAGIAGIQDAMHAFFQQYDVLLTPVVRDPPPPLGALAPDRPYDALSPDMFAYIGYTPLHNVAGLPSVSLPLHISPAGLPIGSMFSAAIGADETLLALSSQLESAAPWAERLPPIHAAHPQSLP